MRFSLFKKVGTTLVGVGAATALSYQAKGKEAAEAKRPSNFYPSTPTLRQVTERRPVTYTRVGR